MTNFWRNGIAAVAVGLCAAALGWAGSQLASAPSRRLPQALAVTRTQGQLISHSEREIVIEFESPFYEALKDPETGEVIQFIVKGAQLLHEPGLPGLPIFAQPVDCPPGEIGFQILQSEEERHPLPSFRPAPKDRPVLREGENSWGGIPQGESWDLAEVKAPRGFWPRRAVEFEEGGVFRGHRLMALRYYPIRVDPQNRAILWTRRVRVRLLLPDWEGTPEYLNRRYDAPNERALLADVLGPLAPAALPTHQIEEPSAPTQGIHSEPSLRFKIVVDEEGIYRISQPMLASAGVPVEQIDPRTIKIKVRAREIPLFVQGEVDGIFDTHDYIEFYGKENRQTYSSLDATMYKDPWSDENVYWLSWNGPYGLRLGEENAEWTPNVGEPVLFLRTTIHYEEDRYYNQLSMGGEPSPYPTRLADLGPYGVIRDHWFYRRGVSAFESLDIPIHIFYPDTQSLGAIRQVTIRAALQGLTFFVPGVCTGHHRAILYLNGYTDRGLSIGKAATGDDQVAWKDQTAVIVQTTPDPYTPGITNRNLHHGDNTLSLSAPGDGLTLGNDEITLNWVEVTYGRQMRAAGGYFRFHFDTTRGTPFEFDIRGFRTPAIEIWKLGMARLTNAEVRRVSPENEPSSWAVRFLMTPGQAYEMIAFDDAYPKTPVAILPEYSTRDLRELAGAEYIMLVHESFLVDPAVDELRQRREATFPGGVEVVTPTEIYEQFNHGIVNPEAIRNFLIYAYAQWPVRPTHLCIIGDGSYDVKDYGHYGGNLIPSLYAISKQYGRAAADGLFGCVSGPAWDLIPDIAVGRISCRTSEELETYVEKIAVYEDSSDYTSAWHSNYIMVADKTDPTFKFGLSFSEPVIRTMPEHANITRVYSDSIQPGQRVTALREAFRQGGVIVNYNGHGGGGLWSGEELMTVASERQLLNRRKYPFITSFTCYSAVFDARYQAEVLGEAFLFQRNANGDLIGGIGVYASTGIGWAYTGVAMQTRLFDFIPFPPGKSLGEIVQISKTRFWMSGSGERLVMDETYSMQVLMNLLGDPGVRLAVPQTLFELTLDTTMVAAGDTVRISGALPFELGGRVALAWYNPCRDYRIWFWRPTPPNNYSVEIDNYPLAEPSLLPEIIASQVFESPALVVPSAFDTSVYRGRYIVYVCNPETEEDAVGCVSFYPYEQLGSTVFEDVEPWPDSVVTTGSPFYIQTKVLNRKGVNRVHMRGVFTPPQGPPVLDTLAMEEVEPNLWRTPLTLGPYAVIEATYHASFTAFDDSGGVASSATYTIPLATRPDIYFSTAYGAPRVVGQTYPQLRVTLVKSTPLYSTPIDTLLLRVKGNFPLTPPYADSFETYGVITGVSNLSKAFTVDIPVHLKSGMWRLVAYIDPDSQIAEFNETNNTRVTVISPAAHFPVSRAHGTYYANPFVSPVYNKYWLFGTRDTLEFKVLPGSLIQDSSVLYYATPRWLTPAESLRAVQSGLLPFSSASRPRVYAVNLPDSTDRLGPNGVVELSLFETTSDPPDTAGKYIFQRRLGSDFWAKLQTVSYEVLLDSFPTPQGWVVYQKGVKYWARTNHLGTFTMFRAVDAQPPRIDIAVNGERFVPGAFVPADPQMFFYLSDGNGIDRRPGRFRVVLDGDTIPYSDIAWTDTIEASGDQVALIRPHLSLGDHELEVYACDNLGNDTTYAAAFQVEGVFDIDFALNYPNPFVEQTKIVYVLTGLTDDYVKVKIYTVAGRLIRTLRETERAVINYRTLGWDGRDEAGELVANGAYFGKITATQAGKRVEKTLKMAKVR
ncbi:MAG: C25 family cysteine peptidase [bacterium]